MPAPKTTLPYQDLLDFADDNRPISEHEAMRHASQIEDYWNNVLYEIRNPRAPNQGPADFISLERLCNDWMEFLRDHDGRFPFRSMRDLAIGGMRWNQYVKQMEHYTSYNFKTGYRE